MHFLNSIKHMLDWVSTCVAGVDLWLEAELNNMFASNGALSPLTTDKLKHFLYSIV